MSDDDAAEAPPPGGDDEQPAESVAHRRRPIIFSAAWRIPVILAATDAPLAPDLRDARREEGREQEDASEDPG